mmetsp:Transcript_7450/g.30285  ORF Transcript_7450/g.30285 Transcript_7450/m.30285 type:complete len:267 (-) Transcript_7450:359-1159(-)
MPSYIMTMSGTFRTHVSSRRLSNMSSVSVGGWPALAFALSPSGPSRILCEEIVDSLANFFFFFAVWSFENWSIRYSSLRWSSVSSSISSLSSVDSAVLRLLDSRSSACIFILRAMERSISVMPSRSRFRRLRRFCTDASATVIANICPASLMPPSVPFESAFISMFLRTLWRILSQRIWLRVGDPLPALLTEPGALILESALGRSPLAWSKAAGVWPGLSDRALPGILPGRSASACSAAGWPPTPMGGPAAPPPPLPPLPTRGASR